LIDPTEFSIESRVEEQTGDLDSCHGSEFWDDNANTISARPSRDLERNVTFSASWVCSPARDLTTSSQDFSQMWAETKEINPLIWLIIFSGRDDSRVVKANAKTGAIASRPPEYECGTTPR
jgi:hypothetical protein